MGPLRSILHMRLATLWNRARNLERDSMAKVFVVFFGIANILGIGFWVSYESFKFVETFPAFGAALNAKIVSLLFFALLVLVVLSTIIVTYTTIFLARETEFLFQFPVPPRTVFLLKVAEAIGLSSWASLFLCLPVLVAFGFLRKAPALYYAELAGVLVVFLLFAGFLGATISLVVAPLVRRLTVRQLVGAGLVLLAVLGWVFLRSFSVWDMDGENNLLILDRFTAQLAAIHSPYFPSHWASSAVLAAAGGHHREVGFQASTLLANTLIFLPVLAWYGRRHYGLQWLLGHHHVQTLGRVRGRGRAPAPEAVPGSRLHATDPAEAPDRATPTGSGPRTDARPVERTRGAGPSRMHTSPIRALALKDLRVFIRDAAQISQSILFVLLMVIYSLSLLRIPQYLTSGSLQLLVYFANLGAVCTILSAFTSRFLFPLISLEGKAFWIVGLAPIPRSAILHEKALCGLAVSLALGLVTATVSNFALHSPAPLFLGALYVVGLTAVCLTALATGLGAAYPVFDEDNPARIAVGLGGTLNFFASALSVAVIIIIEALPYILAERDSRTAWLSTGAEPGGWVFVAHSAALAFVAALSAFCFRLGSHSLARREF